MKLDRDCRNEPRVALFMCVKNEVFRIKEWIAYHSLLGFSNIIVYDNMSTDGTYEILEKIPKEYNISVVRWAKSDKTYQLSAFKDAISRFGNTCDWMGFIDSDEFIVLHSHMSVSAFLGGYNNASAVVINWALFGSSGHVSRPKGLLIEEFTTRSHPSERRARHVKSFVKISTFKDTGPNPHIFDVCGDTVNVLGQNPKWDELGITEYDAIYSCCQLNHYFLRSLSEWREKSLRGYPDQDLGVVDEERIIAEFMAFDNNDIIDLSASLLAGKTKEVIKKIWPE